ncbi:MAG TPA: S41 family peptidase [Myxococcales bacterium]
MRSFRIALVSLLAAACGGNGSGLPPSSDFANLCATPRAGTDDKKGSLDDEKKFLRSWTDELYLWYREVPAVDPAASPTVEDYFSKLKTPAKTATNNPKDRFHFIIPTAVWLQESGSGVTAGYGATFAILAPTVPRKAVVAFTEPGTEGAGKLARGAQILKVDGVDLVNATGQANVDILNGGLFPSAVGQAHTFEVLDLGASASRTVTMTSASITETPVQNAHVIPNTHTGYILFNSHIATAESELINAINTLKANGATDLVLDMRYNGGGFLDIASELAFMIAGPARTSGKTFEKLAFNDKYPTRDPVTGQPLTPTPFEGTASGLDPATPRGAALPHLDLPRLFVLTSGSTCSASESVINSLMGVDVQVILIGGTTCGKPYGFYPQDNCGNTYFSIEFQGVNAKGFGDYADGFIPGGGGSNPAGCRMADDFGHQLGDPAEAQLAGALAFAASGTCPAPAAAALTEAGLRGNGQLFQPEWRMNRIVRR